jgi:hypothetical protein
MSLPSYNETSYYYNKYEITNNNVLLTLTYSSFVNPVPLPKIPTKGRFINEDADDPIIGYNMQVIDPNSG